MATKYVTPGCRLLSRLESGLTIAMTSGTSAICQMIPLVFAARWAASGALAFVSLR
jgi:hypothetical protein